MKEDLISIIVPIYNVENYVNKCIQSLVSQTHSHLEILLIDDGSTDHSGEICEKWAKQDRRIQVLHQKNSGPSKARNVGLQMAKGKWISFVDSDDYVAPQYIEKLYQLVDVNTKVVRIMVNSKYNEIKAGSKEFLQIFENTGEWNTATSQLIEKKFLTEHAIWFHESIKFGEDLLFTIQVIMAAKSIKIIDFDGYHIVERENSITRTINKTAILQNNCELPIVYNQIYKQFQEQLKSFNTNRFFEDINSQILWTFNRYTLKYSEFCTLMKRIYKEVDDIVFEKFNVHKMSYSYKTKIALNCLQKKKIKRYYFLVLFRKMIRK